MAFEDRVVEHPNRWKLINPNDGTDFSVWDMERDEGVVTQEGTPLNAAAFNTCDIAVKQSFSSQNVSGTVVIAKKLGFCTISGALTLHRCSGAANRAEYLYHRAILVSFL